MLSFLKNSSLSISPSTKVIIAIIETILYQMFRVDGQWIKNGFIWGIIRLSKGKTGFHNLKQDKRISLNLWKENNKKNNKANKAILDFLH